MVFVVSVLLAIVGFFVWWFARKKLLVEHN